MDARDLLARLVGITGLDETAAAQVIKLAGIDPPGAAQLLQAYEFAADDGTPSFIEEAWAALQVGLNIAMPLAGALETVAGIQGAVKSL